MKQDDNHLFLTQEKLEEMRARAQMMEDELHDLSNNEYKNTGKLSSTKLSEKTLEYENYLLTIEELEKRKAKIRKGMNFR